MRPRTFIYKLTSDRGGAPCAPKLDGQSDLLTLAICKPAIRRGAQPGDRLLGITSRALAVSDGYPLHSVIYAAVVERIVDAPEYYARDSAFRSRPDCIYVFDDETGSIAHAGRTRLHADPAYVVRDLGTAPYYRNGRTLVCSEFRYFGAEAVQIPARMHHLLDLSQTLGQGHRVSHSEAIEREIDRLFSSLWLRPTRHTPAHVEEETRGHTPRAPKDKRRTSCGIPAIQLF